MDTPVAPFSGTGRCPVLRRLGHLRIVDFSSKWIPEPSIVYQAESVCEYDRAGGVDVIDHWARANSKLQNQSSLLHMSGRRGDASWVELDSIKPPDVTESH